MIWEGNFGASAAGGLSFCIRSNLELGNYLSICSNKGGKPWKPGLKWPTTGPSGYVLTSSQSHSHVTSQLTVSRSVKVSNPIWDSWPDFTSCWHSRFCRGESLSDEDEAVTCTDLLLHLSIKRFSSYLTGNALNPHEKDKPTNPVQGISLFIAIIWNR
jgi:hypothetical protein